MKRNPLFEVNNFLVPKFEISLPFYDAESQYLRWCLALLILLFLFCFVKLYKNNHKALKASLGFLLLLSGLAYTDFGSFHEVGNGKTFSYIHWDDLFHYASGSKYYKEHKRKYFYEAGLIALDEIYQDKDFLKDKFYRRMSDYRLIRATELLDRKQEIKAQFSESRWKEFKDDIYFFHSNYPPQARLVKAFTDHGYNPSPMYTFVARLFSDRSPYTFEYVHLLALIDPILLFIALAFLIWSFGFVGVALSCFIFFLHYPSHFDWASGSFMRFPWFAALCIGLALANKEKYLASGILLGISASFRGFPAICLLALAAPFLWEFAKKDNKDIKYIIPILKIGSASILSLIVLVSCASFKFGGISEFSDWYDNSKFHSTRIPPNTLSTVSLLSFDSKLTSNSIRNYYVNRIYDPEKYGNPEIEFQDLDAFYNGVKKQTLESRVPYYLGLLAIAWILFAFATRGKSPAETIILSLPLLFFGAHTIASYYYCFVALFPLYYFARGKNNTKAGVVLTQCLLLVIVFQHWSAQAYADYDVIFAIQSALLLIFFLGFWTAEVVRKERM